MPRRLLITKEFLLDLLFPNSCLNCREEGNYLCENCFSLVDIMERQFCPVCIKVSLGGTCRGCIRKTELNGLFSAVSYQNKLVKTLIGRYKYEPFVKELTKPLAGS